MMGRFGAFMLMSAVMAAATWLVGWWALPAVAVLWQPADRDGAPARAAAAAAVAWALLLLLIPRAPLGRLLERLAGIFHLPPWGLLLLLLGYASGLAWAAARVTRAFAGLRRTSWQR